MSAKNLLAVGLGLLLLAVGGIWYWLGQGHEDNRPDEVFPVRIAFPVTFSSALPIIALEGGHWRRAGLDVTPITQGTGAECMAVLERGETDFAVAYDTPVVNSILRGTQIRVLSELHAARVNTGLVYRKDRKIKVPADIAGKKVGVISGTNAEFFFDLFLKANVLDPGQIEIVSNSVNSEVEELQSGLLDAAVLWEPHVSSLAKKNPELFGFFTLPFYSEVSMISTTADFADNNQRIMRRVLRGIAAAKKQLEADPEHAKKLVQVFLSQRGMQLDAGAWNKVQFRMGLGHFLQTTLQEQIKQKQLRVHSASSVKIDLHNPDVLPYMEPRPLMTLIPAWVSLK